MRAGLIASVRAVFGLEDKRLWTGLYDVAWILDRHGCPLADLDNVVLDTNRG